MKTPQGKKTPQPQSKKTESAMKVAPPVIAVKKKIYVHVKDPNEHEKLLEMKKTLNNYPGDSEIILMLGSDKQSAIRLPFKAEANDDLKSKLIEIYTEKCIVFK